MRGSSHVQVPTIRSMVETRQQLTAILAHARAGHGPALFGRRGLPHGVVSSWPLYDKLRDLATDHALLASARTIRARLTAPAGTSTVPANRLIESVSATYDVAYYPGFWEDIAALDQSRLDA